MAVEARRIPPGRAPASAPSTVRLTASDGASPVTVSAGPASSARPLASGASCARANAVAAVKSGGVAIVCGAAGTVMLSVTVPAVARRAASTTAARAAGDGARPDRTMPPGPFCACQTKGAGGGGGGGGAAAEGAAP